MASVRALLTVRAEERLDEGERQRGIGRAAGRGRGEISGGAGSLKKKKKMSTVFTSCEKKLNINNVSSIIQCDRPVINIQYSTKSRHGTNTEMSRRAIRLVVRSLLF